MKIKTEGKWMWEEPDQPKPATGGEWTVDTVKFWDFAQIADAHNAALADQKRDLWDKISCSRIEADNWKGLYEKQTAALAAKDFEILCEQKNHKQELANQLTAAELKIAAERIKYENLVVKASIDGVTLREQLAAERSKSELAEYQWKEACKQLAAEREEKVQWQETGVFMELARLRKKNATLVDALKYIAEGEHADEAPEIAQAALAKPHEMAEVTVETSTTDEACPRCGSQICLDHYCVQGHARARPGMQVSNLTELEKAKTKEVRTNE